MIFNHHIFWFLLLKLTENDTDTKRTLENINEDEGLRERSSQSRSETPSPYAPRNILIDNTHSIEDYGIHKSEV